MHGVSGGHGGPPQSSPLVMTNEEVARNRDCTQVGWAGREKTRHGTTGTEGRCPREWILPPSPYPFQVLSRRVSDEEESRAFRLQARPMAPPAVRHVPTTISHMRNLSALTRQEAFLQQVRPSFPSPSTSPMGLTAHAASPVSQGQKETREGTQSPPVCVTPEPVSCLTAS